MTLNRRSWFGTIAAIFTGLDAKAMGKSGPSLKGLAAVGLLRDPKAAREAQINEALYNQMWRAQRPLPSQLPWTDDQNCITIMAFPPASNMTMEFKDGKVIITAEKYVFEATALCPPSAAIGLYLEPAYVALTESLAKHLKPAGSATA
jgi:hypothetical protein